MSTIAATSVQIGPRNYLLVPPKLSDSRLHVAAVTIAVQVLGQTTLGFAVSIPQIIAAIATAAVIELLVTFARQRTFAWPASAMLTGNGVALILRDVGTEAGDYWTFRNWWLFAAISGASLATKYVLRWRGSHLFNPSNIGLVVAFLILGGERIEPLDFWWGGLDAGVVLAYTVIVAGGIVITDRLHLLEMVWAFILALGVLIAALAASGHSIVTAWSLTPIDDWHFWWIVMTSPETILFAFFMITDPRIVPADRRRRIVFAVAVAAASALLMAPHTTEFGAKVGLLGGLVIVCAARPLLQAVLERRSVAVPGHVMVGVTALLLVGAPIAVAVAGRPARAPELAIPATAIMVPADLVPPVAADRVPPITVDPDVSVFGQGLLGPAAEQVGTDLLFALDAENAAVRYQRPGILPVVSHGGRLRATEERVNAATSGTYALLHHEFDSMHLTAVRLTGQGGARLGVASSGTLTAVTFGADGVRAGRTTAPFATTFVMRLADDGRWLLVGVLPDESR
ncbi:MAG: hypothetical protein MAG471_01369 [Acidimicrobiaceae bacterium]|nr:hypothetical protein [Acidimicrobiaceae bacterium]